MPKSVERKKVADEDQKPHQRNWGYIIIVLILVAFGLNVSYETYEEVDELDEAMSQESKKCLFEYSKKSCNSIEPNRECAQIINCIQENDPDTQSIWKIFIDEIVENCMIPLVVIIIVFMYNMVEAIKKQRE